MDIEEVRLSVDADISFITRALKTCVLKPFLTVDAKALLDSSFVSISVVTNNETVALGSFSEYPNFSGILSEPPENWVTWLALCAGHERFNCANTIFLECFVCESQTEQRLGTVLTKVFCVSNLLQYCALICLKECEVDPAVRAYFAPKKLRAEENIRLWVCQRKDLIPMRIREPELKDHSDILRLTESQRIFAEHYGLSFPVDIAQYNKKDTFALVAESKGRTVGFVYASSKQVNLKELNANFETEAFYGMRKPSLQDVNKVPYDMLKPSQREQLKSKGKPEVSTSFPKLHMRQSAYVAGHPNRTKWLKMKSNLDFQHIDDPYEYLHEGNIVTEENNEEILVQKFHLPNRPGKHSLPSIPKFELRPSVPIYSGKRNCFRVFYFATEEKYESEFLFFLMVLFKKLERLSYCLLLTPYLSPLLSIHHHFFHVPPRPLSPFPQALFLFHKAGALLNFHVRLCIKEDFSKIKYLVDALYSRDHILTDAKNYLTGACEDTKVIVATCLNQVIGVAVVKPAVKLEYIFSHFLLDLDIKPNCPQIHGKLSHCILNPAMKLFSKVFLREVMRLTGKTVLFYHVYPGRVAFNDSLWQSGCNVLDDLFPLKPSRLIRYNVDKLNDFAPPEEIMRTTNGFAPYYISRKLCFFQKTLVILRLVVVGSSEAALGFLETLTFRSEFLFKNLTLVSPCGLYGEFTPDDSRNAFLPKSVDYSQERMDRLCLHVSVNVVYGRMKAIRRAEKVLKLEGDAEVPYDYLILACGLQYQRKFQTSVSSKHELEKATATTEDKLLRKTCLRISERTLIQTAENLFAINDVYDAAVALKWLGHKFQSTPGKLIIYGNGVEAYTCLAGILDLNISGDNIVFVKTPNREHSCFRNKAIENAMILLLENIGVTVYSECKLDIEEFDDDISTVIVSNKEMMRSLNCKALFFCHEKKVDYSAYNAIFRAQLHFDGRLLVNAYFQTNDKFIYGVGTLTKFYEDYQAVHYKNVKFNSREGGIYLADRLLRILAPTENDDQRDTDENPTDLPIFKEPVVTFACLPCGYNYLYAENPRYKYDDLNVVGSQTERKETRFRPRKVVISSLDRNVRPPDDRPFSALYDSNKDSESEDEDLLSPTAERMNRVIDWKDSLVTAFDTYVAHSAESEPSEVIRWYDTEEELQKTKEERLRDICKLEGSFGTESDQESQKLKVEAETKKQEHRYEKRLDLSARSSGRKEEYPEHFEIELNEFCEVQAVTCFTKRKIEASNLVRLCGLHYSYLNNFFARLENAKPADIFDFFDQPWCVALYHECFRNFTKDLRVYVNKIQTRNDTDKELYDACQKFAYDEFIRKRLDLYLDYYSSVLPMYSVTNL